ncbi:uncharacterized protein LOC115232215 [Octopus sinensis]|uniref:Uncharacterized protein LOC115232215 n=1 Tax=Octopus sinensis TaxID=2607531 RepID=A0A6P7U6C7_9MOLL|nr:uncharacterized protein LOC115232215 [Octopus sinensis]
MKNEFSVLATRKDEDFRRRRSEKPCLKIARHNRDTSLVIEVFLKCPFIYCSTHFGKAKTNCFCCFSESFPDDLIADDLLQGDYEGLDKRDSSDVDRRAVRYDKLSRFLRINNRGKSKSHKNSCSKWQMACTTSSKRPDARCCSGLVCKCNIWGANCRCDDTLG